MSVTRMRRTGSTPRLPERRRGTRVRYSLIAAVVCVVALAACGGASSGSEGAKKYVFKFSSAQPPTTGLSRQAAAFLDDIEKKTDGRVTFKRYWSSSLLGSTDSAAGIGDGRVDIGYVASAYEPGRFPLWEVGFVSVPNTDMIGLVRAQREMFENSAEWRTEFDKIGTGIKPMIALGISSVTSVGTKQRLNTVEDLDGMSVRFIGSIAAGVKAVGINPVSIAVEEVYESLERGVIDGVGGYALDSYTGQRLEEVAPWVNYLPVGNYASSAAVFMNKQAWESLPDDLQKVVNHAVEQHYSTLPTVLTKSEEAACDALLKAGGGASVLRGDTPAGQKLNGEEVNAAIFQVWRDSATKAGATKEAIAAVEAQYVSAGQKNSPSPDYTPGGELCAKRSDG